MKNIDKCPNCGSDRGYTYCQKVIETRVGDFETWESETEEISGPLERSTRIVKCVDCKGSIRNYEEWG